MVVMVSIQSIALANESVEHICTEKKCAKNPSLGNANKSDNGKKYGTKKVMLKTNTVWKKQTQCGQVSGKRKTKTVNL